MGEEGERNGTEKFSDFNNNIFVLLRHISKTYNTYKNETHKKQDLCIKIILKKERKT
jgi:hypothetical protein